MPKVANQKTRILYLYDFFIRYTDYEHPASLNQISTWLELNGIKSERRTLYDDFEALSNFGVSIISTKGKTATYYVENPKFELVELKLLVDAVQSSKFITLKKANELIKKIQTLTSFHNALDLQRQVYVGGSIKTVNEQIYYSIDTIHTAISKNQKISFKYLDHTLDNGTHYRRDGKRYYLSPMALSWHDDNYYLLAYENDNTLKHYRVDRIEYINIESVKRDYTDEFSKVDMSKYTSRVFSMFGGTEEYVRLVFDLSLLSVVYDKFGKDIIINKISDKQFSINAKIEISEQFYGWVSGLGEKVKITSPEHVKKDYIKHLKLIIKNHKD